MVWCLPDCRNLQDYCINSKFLSLFSYISSLRLISIITGLAVSSGGRFIPGFFRGFFRPEETISSSFFRKKVEETNLF